MTVIKAIVGYLAGPCHLHLAFPVFTVYYSYVLEMLILLHAIRTEVNKPIL